MLLRLPTFGLTGCCVLSEVLVKVCPCGVGLEGIGPTGVTCGFHADTKSPPLCTVRVTLKGKGETYLDEIQGDPNR